MSGEIFDVAIVGYGPVGATAANLLGRLGLRTVVFESTRSIYHLPRAAHFDAEIMRVFQAIGLAEAVQPAVAPLRGMHFLDATGRKLFGFDAPEGTTQHGWPSGFMFYQPDLERALRAGAEALPTVSVRLAHEVLGFIQHAEHVDVSVRDLETDEVRTVRARYLIGCDGARSLVRREAGLGLHDLGFDQAWLVVDTVLERDLPLPLVCQQICDPARPVTFIPSAGRHRRWEFMLLPGEDPVAMQQEGRIQSLLAPWVSPSDARILRAAVYSFHAVLADRWRDGRVLLAGDSAHQMPPFLGQGMCSGIRDVMNLAWRLGLVLGAYAEDSLLDGYFIEREPHVRRIVQAAVSFGRIIQTLDPDLAAQRDAQFLSGGGTPPIHEAKMPGLGNGLLARRQGAAGDPAGEIFPQSWVRTASNEVVRLDDVLGLRFAHVSRADAARVPLPDAFARIGGHRVQVVARGLRAEAAVPGATLVVEIDNVVAPWLASHGSALVRPDRYVLGTANSQADIMGWTDALAKALGRS